MKIFVDADSCPVKDIIIEISNKYNVEAIFVCSFKHNIKAKNVIMVDCHTQSADLEIINRAGFNDIVVTNDYGVVTLALSKNCRCISNNGYIYDEKKLDELLFQKHLTMKLRKRKEFKMKGPKKRNIDDNNRFRTNLIKLINNDLQ